MGSPPDIISRFSPVTELWLVDPLIRLSGVFFFVGSFIVLIGFLTTQSRIPWGRIIVYAFGYGGMIAVYISPAPSLYALFDSLNGMWYVTSDTIWFSIFYAWTITPIAELLILAIRRSRAGVSSSRSRRAIGKFWIGVITPILGPIFAAAFQNQLGVVLSNVTLSIGIGCFALAVNYDPLVFTLSRSKLVHIFITRTDRGDVPIAGYSWVEKKVDFALISPIFPTIDTWMVEISGSTDSDRTQLTNTIQLKDMAIIIERTPHFTGYLIMKGHDEICRYALQRLLQIIEKNYGNLGSLQAVEELPKETFQADVFRTFSFLTV